MGVCLKPRLIHTGIERLNGIVHNSNSPGVLPENEQIETEGKSIQKCIRVCRKIFLLMAVTQIIFLLNISFTI